MSAIRSGLSGLSVGRSRGQSPPSHDALAGERHARRFAESTLAAQAVPLLARRTASRALALLLARSAPAPSEPVFVSAAEAARECGFDPRTWWLVKRRLLELGHLVASTGGGPPTGRPGGRGHKGAYFVAPATLARFQEELRATSAKAPLETRNGAKETLKDSPDHLRGERNLSHHRRADLRLLERKRTSDVRSADVPSLEGDDEQPTVASAWAWARSEPSSRVRARLVALVETLLVLEAWRDRETAGETVMAPDETLVARDETLVAPGETVMPPPESPKPEVTKPEVTRSESVRSETTKRRMRASAPLWSGEAGEEAQVLGHVRSILEWSNREHEAHFPVERSARDTLLYPFERVRAAVANVLLKKARGYRFANPGAVLWDAITLEGYKLEEFAVARLDEVLARIAARPPTPPPRPASGPPSPRPSTGKPPSPPGFEAERRRRELLHELYRRLPESERTALDQRAEALAREELGPVDAPLRLRLLAVDKRNELLGARPDAPSAAISGAREPETNHRESQIPDSGSVRDETEPNHILDSRT